MRYPAIFILGMLWGFVLGAFQIPIWLNLAVSFAAGVGLRIYAEREA